MYLFVLNNCQNFVAKYYGFFRYKKGDISNSRIEKDSSKRRGNRRNIGSTFKNNGTRGKEIVLSISK
ncbi:MAG: hypothetical protein E7152_05595 [Enterococcus casseliflavus]|nr:predicted protein [Enterococcus casseliflavus EC30]EEV34937.1 predicted protein [Enterococcus casseliflavus EC10]MBE6169114.1 hypothetical protein [Enterococcus casseliflavus]